MKRFIPVFILCVIGVCLTACGESNTGTKTSGSTASTPTAAAPAQHFKLGDTVKVGDTWQVVVNSVKTAPGDQYSSLKQGDVYLLVDVTITNISNKEQTTSSIGDWKLTDVSGQAYSATFFSYQLATSDMIFLNRVAHQRKREGHGEDNTCSGTSSTGRCKSKNEKRSKPLV